MTASQKTFRWVEMLALFGGGPMLLWYYDGILGGSRLFAFLLLMGAACTVGLFFDTKFDRTKLWNARPISEAMGWIMLRWLMACMLLTAMFGLFSGVQLPGLSMPVPTGLFGIFLIEAEDYRWLPLIIFLFYPWVSVYPQNVIFRAFFCQRYRSILGPGWGLIIVNALAFSFGHVMFNNWIVLALTFVGGMIFTRTYLKHRSLLLATIEHAMYGLFCFYLGIGVFLLYGASR